MVELGTDIRRVSEGRVTYDARRRRLALHDEEGAVAVEVTIAEKDLRNWLQRLLLGGPHDGGREPRDAAIVLLVARLEAVRHDRAAQEALLREWAS